MENETLRVALLEQKITALTSDMVDEREQLKEMRKELEETRRKINSAEQWGRAVIWTTLGISGFASQFGNIIEWIKKL